MAARICPDCQTALKAFDKEGITLDFCEKCHGVFFDKGELVRLGERFKKNLSQTDATGAKSTAAPVATPKPSGKSRQCPECRYPMEATILSAIEVDRCNRCYGMWLDNGELGQYLQRIAQVAEKDGRLKQAKADGPRWGLGDRYDDWWDSATTFFIVTDLIGAFIDFS